MRNGGRIMDKISTDRGALDTRDKLILLPKYFWPATGGLQIATARIGTALAEIGWQVSIYFPAEPNHHSLPELKIPRLETYAIQGERQEFWKNIPILLGQKTQHASVLAVGLEYDETIDLQIKALRMLCQAGAPTYLRISTTSDIASRINAVRASRLAQLDGIVVLNRAMEKEAENCNFVSQFIHRIPVMVDPNQYRPDKANLVEVRKSKGIQQNISIVLYVGRLDTRKRIELLIKAMVGVDALLWIVGDPTMGPDINETERYLRLAKEYGLRAIKIEPQVPEDEVSDILQAADVFVTASRREGMSNAVLEASSAGLAVAGFTIPGIEEIAEVFNWAGFYLVDPDSGCAGLRQAIQTAFKHSMNNWRLSRENDLIAFSPQKIGALWNLLLSGKPSRTLQREMKILSKM